MCSALTLNRVDISFLEIIFGFLKTNFLEIFFRFATDDSLEIAITHHMRLSIEQIESLSHLN
jgi:hypothetical protein